MVNVLVCGVVLATIYLCAVACERIAASRNRGTDEWFICGAIAGPIAVLTVWFLPALPRGDARATTPGAGG